MAGDDTAQRDAPPDLKTSPGNDETPPHRWPQWATPERAVRARWPIYNSTRDHGEGVLDFTPAAPPQPHRARLIAVVSASVTVAILTVGALVAESAATRASPQTREVVPNSDVAMAQWTRANSAGTAGLVRVQVTPTVEADGIVMTRDGLIATSYARLVGLGGSAASINDVQLRVVPDGATPMRAEIVGFDAAKDVAVLRVPGFRPTSVAKPGAAVKAGSDLTLLDDQGLNLPITGLPVTVTATNQPCSRSGAAIIGRPKGFTFALDAALATAEPGGAVVSSKGALVGMYYGGDADTHCAVPIAEVAEVVDNVRRGKQTATTRVGPAGDLGIRLISADGAYPTVTEIDVRGDLAEAAGVKVGDVLTRIGNTSLKERDLTRMGAEGVIRSLEPGQKVTLEWRSGGRTHRAKITVGVGPQPNG
jgi:putative serine protease PepD